MSFCCSVTKSCPTLVTPWTAFLAMNTIPSSGCTSVCLSTHLLKNIFITSKFWQFYINLLYIHEQVLSGHMFSTISINTKKHDCWITRWVHLDLWSCLVEFDCATPWNVALWTPLSMAILQARILEWVAIPSSGDLPNPGIELRSPALQVDSLPFDLSGKTLVDGRNSRTGGSRSNLWLEEKRNHRTARLEAEIRMRIFLQ